MGYQKPVLFAGLGMIAGAASVAVLTLLVSPPAPGGPRSGPTEAVATLQAPVITGPRSASRPSQLQNGELQKVSLGPQDEIPTISREEQTLVVKSGDTLLGMLVNAGVEQQAAHESIEAIRDVYDPRDLRPGDEITLTFLVGPEDPQFQGFSLDPDPVRTVATTKDDNGGFAASEMKVALSDQTFRYEGEINSSLFMTASEQGMSLGALAELIKIFSYDVDFQRDIQPGDRFEVMYSQQSTPSGQLVGPATVEYAALTLSGRRIPLYRFADKDGFTDYFNEKGQSIRKALLRTPINGARLSSGFGLRRHPVLGFTKMHKGVDFAAPTGTPIYAAGDGVVEMAQVFGGYGNYVRLRHNTSYSTAYAHMSRFGKGISAGTRVRQGDVIGYVGTTGRSTGPHLHYEILKGSKQVNPLNVRFPSGRELAGKELKSFQAARQSMDQRYASLPVASEVASAAIESDPKVQ
jgi:murein DD-endopeptidase MepM/ murein hydrolase activator NlpD